jgi:hypothetical protein
MPRPTPRFCNVSVGSEGQDKGHTAPVITMIGADMMKMLSRMSMDWIARR